MSPLRVKMMNAMKLHRFSPRTQEAYLGAVAGLAKFYHQSPEKIDKYKVQSYLLHLLEDRKLAWISCNVAISGLRFFYIHVLKKKDISLCLPPQKTKSKLPELFTEKELKSLFECADTLTSRVLLMTFYAAGLRVSEVVKRQVQDIDSDRMLICVRQGKGNKDRYTLLSERLLGEMRLYWQRYRPQLWLFPGQGRKRPICISTAQKIYNCAKERAGIKKGGGIHTLRHCFATHLLDREVEPRTIQVLMGHSSIGTTMRYMQVTPKRLGSIKSHLDQMEFQASQPAPWLEKEQVYDHDDLF